MPTLGRRITTIDEPLDVDFVAGQEEALERVTKFVEKVSDNPDIESDVIFELCQLGMGSSAPIASFTFSPGDDISATADVIVDRAVEDGGEAGNGRMKYAVTVRDHKCGRCAFSLQFQQADDDDPDETPNERGALALQMKHNQAFMRQNGAMFESTIKTLQRTVHEQAQELTVLRKEAREGMRALSELYDARDVRQMELQKMQKGEARKDEIAGFLTQGIPLVLQKFLGGAFVGNAATPIEQMMHGFLSSINQEQFSAMTQQGSLPLRQDQLMGFLEIYKAIQEKAEAASTRNAPTHSEHAPYVNGTTGPAQAAPSVTSPPSPSPSP